MFSKIKYTILVQLFMWQLSADDFESKYSDRNCKECIRLFLRDWERLDDYFGIKGMSPNAFEAKFMEDKRLLCFSGLKAKKVRRVLGKPSFERENGRFNYRLYSLDSTDKHVLQVVDFEVDSVGKIVRPGMALGVSEH